MYNLCMEVHSLTFILQALPLRGTSIEAPAILVNRFEVKWWTAVLHVLLMPQDIASRGRADHTVSTTAQQWLLQVTLLEDKIVCNNRNQVPAYTNDKGAMQPNFQPKPHQNGQMVQK